MKFQVKKYDDKDFQNAERIERLYMALMQPLDFRLNDNDSRYLETLSKVYPIVKSKPENEALALIANLEQGKWKSQLAEIYRDAMRLYDPLFISKEVLKAVATQRLIKIASDMEMAYETYDDELAKAKAADVARKSWEAVMKYNRLDVEEAKAGELPPPPNMPRFAIHEMYKDADDAEVVE